MGMLVRVCIILVTAWLALSFGLSSIWLGSLASIALGCAWLVGRELRQPMTASTGLVLFTILTVIGVYLSLPAWAMVVEVTAVLVAWDVHLFEARLANSSRIDKHPALIRIHLQRLVLIAVLSVVLGGIGVGVELQINFLAAIALGGLAVYLLARILRQSR